MRYLLLWQWWVGLTRSNVDGRLASLAHSISAADQRPNVSPKALEATATPSWSKGPNSTISLQPPPFVALVGMTGCEFKPASALSPEIYCHVTEYRIYQFYRCF